MQRVGSRWAMAAVAALGIAVFIVRGRGAAAQDGGADSANARALLTAVRALPAPVCDLVTLALRNTYAIGEASRALGDDGGVPTVGPAAWALGPARSAAPKWRT